MYVLHMYVYFIPLIVIVLNLITLDINLKTHKAFSFTEALDGIGIVYTGCATCEGPRTWTDDLT